MPSRADALYIWRKLEKSVFCRVRVSCFPERCLWSQIFQGFSIVSRLSASVCFWKGLVFPALVPLLHTPRAPYKKSSLSRGSSGLFICCFPVWTSQTELIIHRQGEGKGEICAIERTVWHCRHLGWQVGPDTGHSRVRQGVKGFKVCAAQYGQWGLQH